MFDVAVDSDTIVEDDSVGDLISLLTIGRSVVIVLFCCSCNWTVFDDGKLFDVVTSDTWHGSRFIWNKNGREIKKTLCKLNTNEREKNCAV